MTTLSPRELARRRAVTGAVLTVLVVAAFEGTVVSPAMPTIARELGGLEAYPWMFSSFLASSTVAVLLSGKLADAFGRLPVFVGGLTLFLAGSSLCGSATSLGTLAAFRVLQGLGAGGLQPIAMTISADLYTLEQRAKIQGLFTGAWGAANLLGPLVGGWIVLHGSWRWVFLVNVPVGVVALALMVASYRDPSRGPGLSRGLLLRPLHPAALAPQAVRAGLALSLVTGGIFAACTAYVPLWMTTQRRGDSLAAGLALLPLLLGWALGSSFGVRVLVARGMRVSVAGGLAIAFVGALGLWISVEQELPLGAAMASLGVLGVGLGPAASTSLVAPQASVAWEHRGGVTSAIYAARLLGGSILVSALGVLEGGGSATPAVRFAVLAALALGGALAAARLAPGADRVVREDGGGRYPCAAGRPAAISSGRA